MDLLYLKYEVQVAWYKNTQEEQRSKEYGNCFETFSVYNAVVSFWVQ